MTCPNCVALRTRVAELERQIGTGFGKGHIGAVGSALDISPTEARILLTIYYRDDWTTTATLGRHLDVSVEALRTHMYRIRRRVGMQALESWWGMGYRLSPALRDRIEEVLG